MIRVILRPAAKAPRFVLTEEKVQNSSAAFDTGLSVVGTEIYTYVYSHGKKDYTHLFIFY